MQLLVILVLVAACRKKPDPVPPAEKYATVRVTIDNIAGTEDLELGKWYLNENGDSLNLKTYRYYISNIKFIAANGSEAPEAESYHLVAEDIASSESFVINNLPEGEYSKMSFMIGVDSARNTSGAQNGDLKPENNMFWDWNTGYIMAKMEGTSPSSPYNNKNFSYHINGFSGPYNSLRTIVLTFPATLSLKEGSTPNIHLTADMLEWFKTPNLIKISELPFAMSSNEKITILADNYVDMFKITHVD